MKIGFYNENTAKNAMYVKVKGCTFYFSYNTLVGIDTPQGNQIVMKNYWQGTTGKHLNWIDGGNKASRVDKEVFEKKAKEICKTYKIELPEIDVF